jgi:hypothetical protein
MPTKLAPTNDPHLRRMDEILGYDPADYPDDYATPGGYADAYEGADPYATREPMSQVGADRQYDATLSGGITPFSDPTGNATGFRKEEAVLYDTDLVKPARRGGPDDDSNPLGVPDPDYPPMSSGMSADERQARADVQTREYAEQCRQAARRRMSGEQTRAGPSQVRNALADARVLGASVGRMAVLARQRAAATDALVRAYFDAFQEAQRPPVVNAGVVRFVPKPLPVYGPGPGSYHRAPVVNEAPDILPTAPCFAPGGELVGRSVAGRPLPVMNSGMVNGDYGDTADSLTALAPGGLQYGNGDPSMQHVSQGPLFYGSFAPGYGPSATSGPGTEDPGSVGYSGGGMLSSGAGDPNDEALAMRPLGLFSPDPGDPAEQARDQQKRVLTAACMNQRLRDRA